MWIIWWHSCCSDSTPLLSQTVCDVVRDRQGTAIQHAHLVHVYVGLHLRGGISDYFTNTKIPTQHAILQLNFTRARYSGHVLVSIRLNYSSVHTDHDNVLRPKPGWLARGWSVECLTLDVLSTLCSFNRRRVAAFTSSFLAAMWSAGRRTRPRVSFSNSTATTLSWPCWRATARGVKPSCK